MQDVHQSVAVFYPCELLLDLDGRYISAQSGLLRALHRCQLEHHRLRRFRMGFASYIYLTLGSYEDHIPGYVLLDNQREASLVPLHTGAYDALYFDKFRALHQHRESAAGETQVHHVGGNRKIQAMG